MGVLYPMKKNGSASDDLGKEPSTLKQKVEAGLQFHFGKPVAYALFLRPDPETNQVVVISNSQKAELQKAIARILENWR